MSGKVDVKSVSSQIVETARALEDRFDRRIEAFDPIVPGFTNPRVLGMLQSLVLDYRPKHCVEIGSYMGRSAAAISSALAMLDGDRHLVCIDLFETQLDADYFRMPLIRQIMSNNMGLLEKYANSDEIKDLSDAFDLTARRFTYPNVRLEKRIADSHSRVFKEGERFEFSYIDAGHSYEEVARDLLNLLPNTTDGHVAVFDDYSKQFPGVVEFVDQLLSTGGFEVIGFEHPDIAVIMPDKARAIARINESRRFDALMPLHLA